VSTPPPVRRCPPGRHRWCRDVRHRPHPAAARRHRHRLRPARGPCARRAADARCPDRCRSRRSADPGRGHRGDLDRGPPTTPRSSAAREAGLLVLRRAEMLARLMEDQTAVLIGGTHGKTTTTSMTVVALQAAGRDPSFAIGGSLNESGTNAHAGSDPAVRGRSRRIRPLVPRLPAGHRGRHQRRARPPGRVPDLDAVMQAFRGFLDRRSSGADPLLCADDPGARAR
jgi:hypothetical protein